MDQYGPHWIHGSLGPPEFTIKQHLNQFSGLCRAHHCDGQRDWETTLAVCNNRPHLASTAMRPNNNNDDDSLYTSETQSQSESVSESFGAAVVPRMVVCSNGRIGSIPCLQQSSTRSVGQCPTRWPPCRIYVAPSVQCRKVWLTPTTRLLCSNTAKTQNPLKFAGCPKLANGSQLLVSRSLPYYKDMWRTYRCLTSFFW